MKVLQISHKLPYPPLDGGSIVIHSLTEGLLRQGHQVKMLSMLSPKRAISLEEISPDYVFSTQLKAIYVDTKLKVFPALHNLLFQTESYHTSRFESADFAKTLEGILKIENFDVIQLESIFVLRYVDLIRRCSDAKIVLRTQNVEHIIWENISKNEKNPLKKWYLTKMSSRLKAFELERMGEVDAVIPITDFDARQIQAARPDIARIKAIPFSISLDKFTGLDTEPTVQPNSIFHLGSMDWFPNVEAVDWFLEDVWKSSGLEKSATLHLAGKFMPDRIFDQQSDSLIVEGKISKPIEYMLDKQMMIVPLLSGSGIRVKIIEGMALGKVVISTMRLS
ncbi:MAG: glycosyltransferase, partial [Bacteroidota bacterium]